jgi:hypothetical protein
MANPFKEGEKHKKVPPGGNKPVEPTPVEKEETPIATSETSETQSVIGKDFLSQFVEPKPEGKSYSVYLSAEAGKKLDKLAKQLKCSKSKALDILLRNAVE